MWPPEGRRVCNPYEHEARRIKIPFPCLAQACNGPKLSALHSCRHLVLVLMLWLPAVLLLAWAPARVSAKSSSSSHSSQPTERSPAPLAANKTGACLACTSACAVSGDHAIRSVVVTQPNASRPGTPPLRIERSRLALSPPHNPPLRFSSVVLKRARCSSHPHAAIRLPRHLQALQTSPSHDVCRVLVSFLRKAS